LKLPAPLYKAEIIERKNRFVLICHCCKTRSRRRIYLADTGRLPDIIVPGRRILYHPSDDRSRSTAGTAVLARLGKELVSINSHRANQVAELAIEKGGFPLLENWKLEQSEFSWHNSRFDFLLSRGEKKLMMEVKSVTLVREGVACFPDAVTERGKKHVEELIDWQRGERKRSLMLFLLGRGDGEKFRVCREIDPDFARAVEKAMNEGVMVRALKSSVSISSIKPGPEIPVIE